MSACGHDPVRGLVGMDTAEMRRHPQRSAEVGAERERHKTCCKRGRRPARRAARRAAHVEGIVSYPVDIVIALPISKAERNVRFTEDNAASRLDTRDRQRVLCRNEILVLRKAPCRGQARDIEGFLDEQRNAQEGSPLSLHQRIIGGARCIERTIEVAYTDCIQLRVEAFNSGDGSFRQFASRNLPGRQRRRQFPDRLVFPFDVRHVYNRSQCQAMRSRPT